MRSCRPVVLLLALVLTGCAGRSTDTPAPAAGVAAGWQFADRALVTEGLAAMAHDMGVQCWGMPGLRFVHGNH